MTAARAPSPPIAFVLSDMDGTLLRKDKSLSPRTIEAARGLEAAGIRLAVASSRPPRGMARHVEALGVAGPFAACNGALIVNRDLSIVGERVLPADAARRTLALLAEHGLDAWVFRGADWFVARRDGVRVDWETFTLGFEPTVVPDLAEVAPGAAKIVGVSDDFPAVARAEAAGRIALAGAANVDRSQHYYLDVTHPEATKGRVLERLAGDAGVPLERTAAVGDGENDIHMLRLAGFAVAMGNASDTVKAAADVVTASNEEDGFALAIERHILPRAPGRPA